MPAVAAVLDSRDGLLPRRVEEADEADEDGVRIDIGEGKVVLVGVNRLHGEAEHALAARGQLHRRPVPLLALERQVARLRALGRTHRHHPFRGALDEDEGLALMAVVQRRHEAVQGIEGDLVRARQLLAQQRRIEPGLHGQRHQRRLHRIAVRPPFAVDLTQLRVVAQETGAQEFHQDAVARRIAVGTAHAEAAIRRPPASGHLVLAGLGHDACRRHLVAGQRAGLVGADDRHRAQRFGGRQAADDGMARRHALHADGQRDRHDRRQALGDGRYRDADHHHEGVADGVVAEEEGEEEDQRRDDQNAGGELAGKTVHLADERRLQRFDRAKQDADAAEFALPAGGSRDADALAGGDERAGKGHRLAIADGGLRVDRHGRLVGRHRFAGEDRFVDAEAAGADQADIGRHAGPGLDEHDVAGHDRIGSNGDAVAIAQDRRLGVDHAADRLERLCRLALLDEADQRVGERHRQHHAGIDPVVQRRRQRRCHQAVRR